ncbi:MAG TPA: DMT family transporter [Candidatus Methylomirabilis sp.]|jgi:drug/metabolite transporter (DMT)-like permease
MRGDTRASVLVLVGATLLGSLPAWGRAIYRFEPDPLTVVTWRALFAAGLLLLALAGLRRELLGVRPRDLPFFAAYGLLAVTLNFLAYFSAVKYTSIAVAVILLYTYPAFVTLLSAIFLGERLTARKGVALLLTFAGAVLVIRVYQPAALRLNLRGILWGLTAGVTAALYSIFGKKALGRYNPFTVVLYAFGLGGIFLALLRGPAALVALRYPGVVWLLLLGLAAIPTLGGYTCYTVGLRQLEASRASILATWEVVAATALGYLLFAEALDAGQIAGALLVVIGIAWLERS